MALKTKPRKISAKTSYEAQRMMEIDELQGDIFTFILRPEKYSVLGNARSQNVDCEVEDHALSLQSKLTAAVVDLVVLARRGDKTAIGALANHASFVIHSLNEMVDQNGKALQAIEKLAAKSKVWPQLIGKHSDDLKEAKKRLERIGVGTKRGKQVGFSNLYSENQPFKAMLGGYIARSVSSIRRVRDQQKLFERDFSMGIQLPQWIIDALALPKEEARWCSFALRLLKEVNGGGVSS
jgi:hypothetical protein